MPDQKVFFDNVEESYRTLKTEIEFIKKASYHKEIGYKTTIKSLLELLKTLNIDETISFSLLEELKNSKHLGPSDVVRTELTELFSQIWEKKSNDDDNKLLNLNQANITNQKVNELNEGSDLIKIDASLGYKRKTRNRITSEISNNSKSAISIVDSWGLDRPPLPRTPLGTLPHPNNTAEMEYINNSKHN